MHAMTLPQIGYRKIGHAREGLADASLPWIVLTGPSQGSMMAMVTNMARIVVIPKKGQVVTAATSMSIFSDSLSTFLSANGTRGSEISRLVGGTTSPVSGINANVAQPRDCRPRSTHPNAPSENRSTLW